MRFVIVIILLISNISCSQKNQPKIETKAITSEVPKKDFIAEGYIKAQVKDMTGLDGCRFLLILEDGNKLIPNKLTDEFAVNEKMVWIKYSIQKNAMTTCMSGKSVIISEILERK